MLCRPLKKCLMAQVPSIVNVDSVEQSLIINSDEVWEDMRIMACHYLASQDYYFNGTIV